MANLYKVAIIGLGSIGNRHLQNIVSVLTEQGKTFIVDLIRSGKGKDIDTNVSEYINKIYNAYDSAPDDYDVVFITNPTYLHFETVKYFVSKTKHMFIEKPVFDNVDISLGELNLKKDNIYYVACPLRYTDVIQYLKYSCNLRNVNSVRVISSSYLPEWRPNQDYRNSYSAHTDQGGGVSIDLIHEWDYIIYLFGQPQQIFNIKGKFSNLEINSDDLSLYIARYSNMALELHLDYFGRKTMREIQIFTDEDTIVGDLTNSEIRYLKNEKVISFKEQRNDFQRKEIVHFFDIIDGRTVNDNDIMNAIRTIQIALEGDYK
jgi:predicted dehydrogenase